MAKREDEFDLKSVLLLASRVREAQRRSLGDATRRMERLLDRELDRVLGGKVPRPSPRGEGAPR